jgi:hypothetical protein
VCVMNFTVSATEFGASLLEIFRNSRNGIYPAPSLKTWQGLRYSAPI